MILYFIPVICGANFVVTLSKGGTMIVLPFKFVCQQRLFNKTLKKSFKLNFNSTIKFMNSQKTKTYF